MPSSQSPSPSSSTSEISLTDFGANEWIVEEMYQRYKEDPGSVAPEWGEFFADYTPTAAASSSESQKPATAATDAQATPAPASTPAPAQKAEQKKSDKADIPHAETRTIRGAASRIVTNMDASLSVPTATSVRAIPAKLLIDNRTVINNHLKRAQGGKISFTHLIGFALVKAVQKHPEMNNSFIELDGKPTLVTPEHTNVGLAIDLQQGKQRSLVVASIKNAEDMTFTQFWAAYQEIVRKARDGKLSLEDFADTTITLTNPGTIGTVHSIPRLMQNQGTIIGVGSMEYPAEFSGMSEDTLIEMGVGKRLTLTSTYDHRIIQGAQSGEFLKYIDELLLGAEGFYEEIFASLRIPYEPVQWSRDLAVADGEIDKNARILQLINAYRSEGHFLADTDPLSYTQRKHPDLDPLGHGLSLWDLERTFPVGGFAGQSKMTLRDVLGVLRDSYCRRIGVEYMHITDPTERDWIQSRVEHPYQKPSQERQKQILDKLGAAEAFETFLHTKYVGQKRFSLEGGESVIPLLDEVINAAAEDLLSEVVIGMAHRGRLNVLANVADKPYEQIFAEFEGNIDPGTAHGSGDVKYHLGTSSEVSTPDGKYSITVSLTSNPSHLEAVDPVVEGIARAKGDLLDQGPGIFPVLPLLIHGDAAFAGQGVVAETLNLSQLRGYRTGGTVHVIINNQVGFTTAPEHSRSSLYATDVARSVAAPIFHVNGDDPEACSHVARLAFEYRQAFNKDVVIDMVCYRRRGHNEGDDPAMTSPKMYKIIDAKRSVRKLYTEALVGRGDISVEEAESALKEFHTKLEEAFKATKGTRNTPTQIPVSRETDAPISTAVDADTIAIIGQAQTSFLDTFSAHTRVKPVQERREKMSREGDVDWAFGELLAFGSLLLDGRTVRLTGQDTRRGTFSQRHSVLIDTETGAEYTPLQHLSDEQGRFFVYDSLLSEYATMGFEYGYSLANPNALVLWEAQFGDFVNGAQTIVDEFISSGEAKWGQTSGVTLLLPHGYEGQGPDHSSGRMERFLQLYAEKNMTVANCSTPASYFHLLRRQALNHEHKPLVVFTPKSLLRNKSALSPLEEFTSGSFHPVLPDTSGVRAEDVRRVLLCSGKVYYDLDAARTTRDIQDTAILRLEQLAPLPVEEIAKAFAEYPNATDHVWVQEEPANQGAWSFVMMSLLEQEAGVQLRRVSRKASASPAVGSAKHHTAEQQELVELALKRE